MHPFFLWGYKSNSFSTSGSKFHSHFRKLNLLKEPYLSENFLEVKETLQLYLSFLNN